MTHSRIQVRTGLVLLFAAMALAVVAGPALAQSSIGIGAAEPAAAPVSGGLLGEFGRFVFQEQQRFYKLMTDALRTMRHEPAAGWTLAGLSFLYGILHAAGPGHGKAAISTYMVANEVALRRGIALSFISALVQGAVAVAIIAAVFLVLRGTAISQTDTVFTLEILSYAFLTGFGLWLLARKLLPLLRTALQRRSLALSLMGAGAGGSLLAAGPHPHGSHFHGVTPHHHPADGPDENCPSCGHAHMPDPQDISSDRLRMREALSAVIAVGLRPCSGALIVLTFAFLNGMIIGGIASVLAMALGTAITVAALATMAVTAKNVAVRFAGGAGSRMAARVQLAIELLGASLISLLGLAMLAGALATA